jgi:pilus assembly protein Flp/PilA
MLFEEDAMGSWPLRLCLKIRDFAKSEEGQDLVEYALVIALIALGAVTSMKTLDQAISTEFTTISSLFKNAV